MGQDSHCGRCKDKWGVNWQITPRVLTEALAQRSDRLRRVAPRLQRAVGGRCAVVEQTGLGTGEFVIAQHTAPPLLVRTFQSMAQRGRPSCGHGSLTGNSAHRVRHAPVADAAARHVCRVIGAWHASTASSWASSAWKTRCTWP